MRIGKNIAALAMLASSIGTPHAGGASASASFDQSGVIIDVHTFFTAAIQETDKSGVEAVRDTVAGRALVTEEGVYAFLETPENQEHLRETEPGSVVRIKGRLLEKGALLHIDKLEKINKVALIDFARFRNDRGKEATLKGTNKCQCGLDVGDLPHSCKLGHLHHLEAMDGKIYHYLQFAEGKDAFLGSGSHFKSVEVKARVLPGNFLLVQEVNVE